MKLRISSVRFAHFCKNVLTYNIGKRVRRLYLQDRHLTLQVKYWSGNMLGISFSMSPENLSFRTYDSSDKTVT